MRAFVDATRAAVRETNWLSALCLALSMPDMCAWIETGKTNGKRYAGWFDRYLLDLYSALIRQGDAQQFTSHVFLSGDDCYALRCALLHQGTDDITDQSARDVLERFVFVAPRPGQFFHRNRRNWVVKLERHSVLHLEVDSFAEEMCRAVERWLAGPVSADASMQARMSKLIQIR